jgi:hypothetical protein
MGLPCGYWYTSRSWNVLFIPDRMAHEFLLATVRVGSQQLVDECQLTNKGDL